MSLFIYFLIAAVILALLALLYKRNDETTMSYGALAVSGLSLFFAILTGAGL